MNQVMIVTGGSRGIGAATARLAATRGYAVCVNYRQDRVNAVRPGFIRTEIHDSTGEPNRLERLKELVPMKRAGEALEVATAILWLCSDEASYTSGAIIDVGGGK